MIDRPGEAGELLDLPRELHERTGTRSLIVFDEIQDIFAVPGKWASIIVRCRVAHRKPQGVDK
jgi:hypothetical protein